MYLACPKATAAICQFPIIDYCLHLVYVCISFPKISQLKISFLLLTLSVGLLGNTICRGGGGVSSSLAETWPGGVSVSLADTLLERSAPSVSVSLGISSLAGGRGGGGVSSLWVVGGEGLWLAWCVLAGVFRPERSQRWSAAVLGRPNSSRIFCF